jgi:ABC-type amino acid transport substrate-binding protein
VFLTDEPYAVVVRAGDELLLENLNNSLAKLIDSGVLYQIKTNWLSN